MKRLPYRRLAVAIALPVLLGGCVPDDAFTPKVAPTLDAALADVAHPALSWASQWFSGASVITPKILPTRCPFESASGSFVCSPLTARGLTLTQRFTLLDAAGGKQSAYDPAATTALHLENSVAGAPSDQGPTMNVDGQQTLDLTSLGSSRHTLNGTSLTVTTTSDPATASVITREFRTTISDLVLPVVAADAPPGWPLSGTIDVRSRITNRPEPYVFIATMRFDGSSVVTLTLTVPGGLQTCRVNIATTPGGGIGCPLGSPDVPIGAVLTGQAPALR